LSAAPLVVIACCLLTASLVAQEADSSAASEVGLASATASLRAGLQPNSEGVQVLWVRPDSEAARAKVHRGQTIRAIDGVPATGRTPQEIQATLARLSGPPGSTMRLTVSYFQADNRIDKLVIREAEIGDPFERAWRAYLDQQHATTIELLDQLLAAPERDPDAYYLRARARLALGELDLALKDAFAFETLAVDFAGVPVNAPYELIGDIYVASEELALARPAFEQAFGLNPGSDHVVAELARICGALGDFEAAERWQADLERRLPSTPDLALQRGVSLERLGKHAQALPFLDRAVAAAPLSADAHFLRGQCCWALGDFAQAAASFGRAGELAPANASIQLALGAALTHSGAAKQAIDALSRLMEREPADGRLPIHLAVAHYAAGELDAALLDLRRFSSPARARRGRAAEPGEQLVEPAELRHVIAGLTGLIDAERGLDAEARTKLGAAFRGMTGATLLDLERLVGMGLARRPDAPLLAEFRADVLRRREAAQAFADSATAATSEARLQRLNRALELAPDYVAALSRRGRFFSTEEVRADAAREDVERAVALEPEAADALAASAFFHECWGHREEALEWSARLRDLHPQLAAGHAGVEKAQSDFAEWQKALDAFDEALRIDPDAREAERLRASCLYHLHRYAEASAAFASYANRYPRDPEALNEWGGVLADMGAPELAIPKYSELLDLPDLPRSTAWCGYYFRALCEHALEHYDRALADVARAREIDPTWDYPDLRSPEAIAASAPQPTTTELETASTPAVVREAPRTCFYCNGGGSRRVEDWSIESFKSDWDRYREKVTGWSQETGWRWQTTGRWETCTVCDGLGYTLAE
jgi:tetratricopeptide (TPR) repeat protein